MIFLHARRKQPLWFAMFFFSPFYFIPFRCLWGSHFCDKFNENILQLLKASMSFWNAFLVSWFITILLALLANSRQKQDWQSERNYLIMRNAWFNFPHRSVFRLIRSHYVLQLLMSNRNRNRNRRRCRRRLKMLFICMMCLVNRVCWRWAWLQIDIITPQSDSNKPTSI